MNEALIVTVRGIIGFFTLLIFARILGKQQISQLTFFEYVVGITIGSTASTLTTDLTSSAWSHWVGLLVWTAACFILQYISIKWRTASIYLAGEPTIVIMDGKILEDNMHKYRYTLDDLLEQLRDKEVFDINKVAYAILEKDGQLSVLKKSEYNPVTPKDLNIKTQPSNIGIELIYNGIVIDNNLNQINKNRTWLNKELKKLSITSPTQVFLASYNSESGLYIDLYKDHVNN